MKLLNLIVLAFLIIIIAPCSLDHYSPDTSFNIKIKFPHKSKSQSESRSQSKSVVLNKPADAGDDYVPSFVDRIWLKGVGDRSGEQIIDTIKTDGVLINEISLNNLSLGENYTLEVKTYTCNETDLNCCETSTEGCDQNNEWIEVYNGNFGPVIIESVGENTQIDFTLERISGITLDKEPKIIGSLEIDDSYKDYCIAVDSYGNIGIHYQKPLGGRSDVFIFDSKGRTKGDNQPIIFLNPNREIMLSIPSRSCAILNGELIVPLATFEKNIWLGKIDSTVENPEPEYENVFNLQDGPEFPEILFETYNITDIYIESGNGYIVVVATAESSDPSYPLILDKGRVFFTVLDENLENYGNWEPSEFSDDSGDFRKGKAFIFDENTFAITSVRDALTSNPTKFYGYLFNPLQRPVDPLIPNKISGDLQYADDEDKYSIVRLDNGAFIRVSHRIVDEVAVLSEIDTSFTNEGVAELWIPGLMKRKDWFMERINNGKVLGVFVSKESGNIQISSAYFNSLPIYLETEFLNPQPSTDTANDLELPKFDSNEDGFTVISWIGPDPNNATVKRIFFKRYLL